MRTKFINHLLTAIIITATCTSSVVMAKKKSAKNNPTTPLTAGGQILASKYTQQLQILKADLTASLPRVDKRRISAYTDALAAEATAKSNSEAAQKKIDAIGKAKGAVGHAKGKWIGGADKGIAKAKVALQKANSKAERDAANKQLIDWEKNRADGVAALKERQAVLDKAMAGQKNAQKIMADAKKTLANAKIETLKSVSNLGLSTLLTSDKLDAKLAKYTVMSNATSAGLAAFAQQGAEQEKMLNTVLSSEKLLTQISIADGAKNGNYGRAIQIYYDISNASSKNKTQADKDTLQRLALAISLEHATPIKQRNAVAKKDAPATVDPVKRYLHYEKALLNGELDPAFKYMSVWDYRMVVDGQEPDEILTWGREMLRNYRPDHISTPDYRWRYVASVRSDVPYGSQDNKYDEDQLQFFQNILKNGGICGRRAFFGRFSLRAFGIPTTARPQRGHAALAHWTPAGWVINLGGGWGAGWTKTLYKQDTDFLATTQARSAGKQFLQVKRAQWIGNVMDETPVYGLGSKRAPEFWYGISLYIQKNVIKSVDAKTLAAVGQDIAEANETKEKVLVTKVTMTAKDREISVNNNGVITIPAVASTKPTKSSGKIIFMDSYLGGKQLHYSRTSKHQVFEYTFSAKSAGKYQLTANVVTPSWKQSLLLTVNSAEQQTKIELPFTIGMWEKTQPITIELKRGKNQLTFTREGSAKGITIKDFTLTPIK
ncbi:MAG: hypothetical protein ACJAR1_002345 [Rubritalea sp.]|jgi:hypothetical protein